MDFSPRSFMVADYVIFALMLVVSTVIGLFFVIKDRNRQNTEEYLLAGRSLSAYPVAFSLSVGFMSAVLVLGTPSEIYRFGTMYGWFFVSFVITAIVTAEIYIPIFYKLQLTSVYEYLEKRFNRVIRIEGTMLYMLQTVLYIGIVIYAPALALNAVTGFNLWAAVISTGFICIFYSSLGGLKAVIWTDAFQAVIMLTGFVSVIIQGCVLQGGIENVWRKCEEGGRIQFSKFDADPRERHTVWTLSVGGTFLFLALYAVNQGQVQRYLSCRSIREAKKSILLNVIGLFLLNGFAILCGLILYAYYKDCDPLSLGVVAQPDQLLPYMVLDFFKNHPGMPGLFIACVYSGSLSTVSTAITGLASVTVEDFLKPVTKFEDRTYTWISRGLVVFYGIVCMVFAYLTSTLGAVLQAAISVLGLVGGPLLALYTLGMMFPFVNTIGSFVGINAGLAANIWVFIGSRNYPPSAGFTDELPLSTQSCPVVLFNSSTTVESTTAAFIETTPIPFQPPPVSPPVADLYAMSYVLYAPFGFCWTVVIGIVVSLLTCGHRTRRVVDPQLIYPFFDHWIFGCFPKGFKRLLRCGVNYDETKTSEPDDVSAEKLEETKIPRVDWSSSSMEKKEEYINECYMDEDQVTRI